MEGFGEAKNLLSQSFTTPPSTQVHVTVQSHGLQADDIACKMDAVQGTAGSLLIL